MKKFLDILAYIILSIAVVGGAIAVALVTITILPMHPELSRNFLISYAITLPIIWALYRIAN